MRIKSLVLSALLMLSIPAFAQDTSVAVATNTIGDNLDLELVSAEFGAAKDLEDFERRLNDPKSQVSNLDLNKDGQVDYLMVSERANGNLHYVDIDASIGKDKKQNVATIKVNKESSSEPVQIIGETSIYGSNYIYVPTYVNPPVFFTLFWLAAYQPWHSPWHWGYYPPVFRPWGVRPFSSYRGDVDININKHNNVIVRKDRHNRVNTGIDRNRSDNKIGRNVENKIGDRSERGNIDQKKLKRNERNVAAKPNLQNKTNQDNLGGKLDGHANHADHPNVDKAKIADHSQVGHNNASNVAKNKVNNVKANNVKAKVPAKSSVRNNRVQPRAKAAKTPARAHR